MPLRDIADQPRAIAILRGALTRDRVSQAYLFVGPEGADKEGCARALVQALACEKPVSKDGCGECDGCRRVMRGSHPDVTWIFSEVEQLKRKLLGRSDLDGSPSRDIKIGQVRELQARLSLTPLVMHRKAAVIVDAHQMNVPAQNALLKVLEEPPPGSTLILITSAPDALLPTVRSRCTRITFAPPSLEAVAKRVEKETGLPHDAALLSARLSGGNLRLALEASAEDLESRRRLAVALDDLPRDARAVLRLAEELGESRDSAEASLDIAAAWLHDVAVAAATGEALPSTVVNSDLADRVLASGRKLGAIEALRRHDLCMEAREALARNGSPRLHLEHALLSMVYP